MNADQAKPRRRVRLFFLIVLLFATLGPLTGSVMYMLTVAVAKVRQFTDLYGVLLAPLFGLLLVPFAFALGVFPAAFVGVIVGACEAFFAPVGWLLASALGIVSGLAFVLVTDGFGTIPNFWHEPEVAVAQMLACIVATIVCWLALRWRLSRPAHAGTSA